MELDQCSNTSCSSVLNTEVSKFQGVGIEGFYCIQKYPHSRVLE